MRNNLSTPANQTENRVVVTLITLTLFAACLPYLLGYFSTPPGAFFVGTVYNIDDYCNYLSWLRQMADGHFFLRNLFTTEPQHGLQFNLFFWILGRFMALTHCSPQAALQLARVSGGMVLLNLIYRFYRHCLPDNRYARLTAFGFACLGSGFGWVQWLHWSDKNFSGGPVDAWQPEAYTFLSIYTSALMTVSTVLILGALYALLLGEQTGKWKYPVIAGICGGILGNIHSYDVLHLAAAWGLFLVVWTVLTRGQGMAIRWARACTALALTLPTTGYMVYLLKHESVFAKRAAVPTLSPEIWHYFLGYGLVFVLAIVAVMVVGSKYKDRAEYKEASGRAGARERAGASPAPTVVMLFVVCWAVAGLGVIYLPFAFQRKMLMGEHIPLCLLAGVGASCLAGQTAPRARVWILSMLVLASTPSNFLFLVRDINHLQNNRSETHLIPYLPGPQVDVYQWVRDNTPSTASVVGLPSLCTYLPGEAGRAVWAGHWGETPQYASKEKEFADAFDTQTSGSDRQAFLLSTGAGYFFYPNDVSQLTFQRRDGLHHFVELTAAPPAYLREVHKNEMFTIYDPALNWCLQSKH